MADRGVDTLRYGPMKGVGLDNPRTGRWPYAVVQLRQDNALGTLWNMVGLQTKLKQGETQVVKACGSADGQPDPALLGEEGDKCEIKNSYIRNGRMSAQMSCRREGMSGEVMPAMMGSFSKDGFEGEITTLTYFVKDGDYRMTRKVAGKRIGDCPAGGVPGTAS